MSTCKGLRHNMCSYFSHFCCFDFFPNILTSTFQLLELISHGCACVCMEYAEKLSAFLQLIHIPHLFGLHFPLSSLSPSHHSRSPPFSVFFFLPISFFQFLSLSLTFSLTADRYLGLNWLKGEKKPVKLRRQAVGGQPAYLLGLFMLQE